MSNYTADKKVITIKQVINSSLLSCKVKDEWYGTSEYYTNLSPIIDIFLEEYLLLTILKIEIHGYVKLNKIMLGIFQGGRSAKTRAKTR